MSRTRADHERIATLRDHLERHLRDEEERIFAQALSHLSEARLEKIGSDMQARREKLGSSTV